MSSHRHTPLALLVAMVLAAVFFELDSLGNLRILEPVEVEDCDGAPLALDGVKAELLRLHNEGRAKAGVPPLCVHPRLRAAAQAHAEDMLERGFYAHDAPEGTDPGARIARAGYPWATYGENNNRVTGDDLVGEPGAGEVREAVESWLRSPGHRENLLNPAFREVGFGAATGRFAPEPGNTTMWVADFGARR